MSTTTATSTLTEEQIANNNAAAEALQASYHKYAPQGDQLQLLLDTYAKFKKLPTNHVQCTYSGIQVTMFGTNLEGRIEKYSKPEDGDITIMENRLKALKRLLTTFIGKEGKKLAQVNHPDALLDQPKSNSGFGHSRVPKTADEIALMIASLQEQQRQLQNVATAKAPVSAEVKQEQPVIEPTSAPVESVVEQVAQTETAPEIQAEVPAETAPESVEAPAMSDEALEAEMATAEQNTGRGNKRRH